jgi:hypothetical protein
MRGQMNWEHLPDRHWLQHQYLPQLTGDLLFVGVEQCTDFYHELTPARMITIDVDPARSIYGSPTLHWVQDVLDHNPPERYDHICMHGVLGFCSGLKHHDLYHHKLHELLKPGGTVMLGHHVAPECSRKFWMGTMAQPPFIDYKTLARPTGISSNAMWWGRKPEHAPRHL